MEACCDYRDHGGIPCACTEHPQDNLHPFGWRPTRPPHLAVDADGFVWQVNDDGMSMARTNPDNVPTPKPVTFYAPVVCPGCGTNIPPGVAACRDCQTQAGPWE